MLRTVKDTNGNEYFVAGVIRSDYPNHWQVNIGQSLYPNGKPRPDRGVCLPKDIAERWFKNEIRVKI